MDISMKCIKIGCTEASLTVLFIRKQFGGQNNPVEIIAMNKTLFNHDLNVSKFFFCHCPQWKFPSVMSTMTQLTLRLLNAKVPQSKGKKDKVKYKVKDEDKGISHPAKARALSLTI